MFLKPTLVVEVVRRSSVPLYTSSPPPHSWHTQEWQGVEGEARRENTRRAVLVENMERVRSEETSGSFIEESRDVT